MRRVVVTGMGIVSSIGNNTQEVLASLREAKSGIVRAEKYAELGFRCHVHGEPHIEWEGMIPRKPKRFMEAGIGWNYIAMDQAIRDAGLEPADVVNERSGIIMGAGGPSTRAIVRAADVTREKDPKKVGPFEVPKGMCSGPSAALATAFQIKGVNYSISSACATSAHCIGNAAELIQWGKQDVMFAGGCEELDWTLSVLFDAMGAMSTKFNATPARASRAYDKDRDGFVIAGGAGVLVLEELQRAKARGAKIYGEVVGYGATSDGFDMVAPSGEGAVRCMRIAMKGMDGKGVGKIDYINPHGTATPVGDLREIEAVREVFGKDIPAISSTKSLTGHSLGAAGVQEAIYSLLMLNNGFVCESANIDELDPDFADVPIALKRQDNLSLNCVMSNSFGFGGTNATLVLRRCDA
ncbi:MAG: beta-ketoacyl-ACP synthase I [Hyphomicrobiaceae bacterium]|nr:MAG: beta-ketoacyl-ACP synthase I [Hyphomicrobiaceae bacterium]